MKEAMKKTTMKRKKKKMVMAVDGRMVMKMFGGRSGEEAGIGGEGGGGRVRPP